MIRERIVIDENISRDFKEFVINFLESHRGNACPIPAKTLINRFVYSKSHSPVSGKHRYNYLEQHNLTISQFYIILREMALEGVIAKEKTTHKLKIMAVPA